MSSFRGFVLAGVCLFGASCTTTRPVGGALSLNKDTPQVCSRHCDAMGMRLAAVVIISSSEGCVCEPRDARPASAESREGVGAAGIAPILAAAAAAAQQQLQHQQSQGATGAGWQPPPPYVPPPLPPPPPGR